eukprot:g22089.t1
MLRSGQLQETSSVLMKDDGSGVLESLGPTDLREVVVAYARSRWACQPMVKAVGDQLSMLEGTDLSLLQILAPVLVAFSRLRWPHTRLQERTLTTLQDLEETTRHVEGESGRVWLASEFEPISLLKGDIVVAETYKRMKQERMQASEEKERKKRSEWQKEQQQKLLEFLKKHHFNTKDVNGVGEVKKRFFGMMSSYQRPLHKAAKEKNVEIILLLLQYGADPMSKDSKGKTAYDYVESSPLRARMKAVYVKSPLQDTDARSMARVVSLSAQALQGSAMLGGTQDLWLTTCEVAAQRLLLACPDSVWMQLSAWKSSGLGPELWDEEESEDVERERCWERELLFGVFVLAFMQQPSKALGHRAPRVSGTERLDQWLGVELKGSWRFIVVG